MTETTKRLRYGIVGCGRIAQRHAIQIDRLGDLVASCDCEQERADAIAARYGGDSFSDLETMLTDKASLIDLVAVCTPNGLHAEHTIRCLQAGCHVLCEKPMALSSRDCGRMIQAAERANRRLFVVKQNRYNPPVVAVKKLIDDGQLGHLYSLHLTCIWNRPPEYYQGNWKGTLDLDGGTLYTQFSHFMDLLYWLVGDVDAIQAYTHNHAHGDVADFEDSGVAAIQFECGALGAIHFSTNSYNRNMEGSLTIVAENGTVKIGGQYLNELEYCNCRSPMIDALPVGNPPNAYGYYEGSMSNHDKVYDNTLDVLTNGGTVTTNAFEGLKTVEIIERIYEAATENAYRSRSRPSRGRSAMQAPPHQAVVGE